MLLRHLLEHLPPGMVEKTLAEALRVARLAVVLDFHTPLLERGERQISRIAENFLLTRWTAPEITELVKKAGWQVADRFCLRGRPDETDTVSAAAGVPKKISRAAEGQYHHAYLPAQSRDSENGAADPGSNAHQLGTNLD